MTAAWKIDRRPLAAALVADILVDVDPHQDMRDLVSELIVDLAPFSRVPSILEETP